MQPNPFHTRVQTASKTLQLFFGIQLFCAVMMISFGLGGPAVFGVIIAIPPLLAWFSGRRRGYIFIIYFICITFVVGQRTFHIGQYVRIVPSELLMWILALTALFIHPQYKTGKLPIPLAAFFLFFFSALGVYTASTIENLDMNLAFFYASMMWMAVPAFLVVSRFINRVEHMQNIATLLAFECLFLSFLAMAEYFDLGFVKLFSGYIKGETIMGQEDFKRISASFWGGPMMSAFIAMCFPFIFVQWQSTKSIVLKLLFAISMVLSLLTIYFSGHRGLWIPFLIGISLFFILKGIRGAVVLGILLLVAIPLIPESAIRRFEAVQGENQDTSAKKRQEMAEYTWRMLQEKPVLGHGWGASGLPHSDLLQMGADAGGFTLLSFLMIFLGVIFRLFTLKVRKIKLFKEYRDALLSSLAMGIAILSCQAWFNLPEQYAPFWFIVALAYNYPQLVMTETKLMNSPTQIVLLPKENSHA